MYLRGNIIPVTKTKRQVISRRLMVSIVEELQKSRTARIRNCATRDEHSSNGCTFDAFGHPTAGKSCLSDMITVLKRNQGRKKMGAGAPIWNSRKIFLPSS